MSTKPTDELMTAQVFAEEMGVHYRTALSWLRNGLVPGAIEQQTPMGNYWQIPRDALQMEKPKPGPKPKTTNGDQAEAPAAEAAKPKRRTSNRSAAKKALKKMRKGGAAK